MKNNAVIKIIKCIVDFTDKLKTNEAENKIIKSVYDFDNEEISISNKKDIEYVIKSYLTSQYPNYIIDIKFDNLYISNQIVYHQLNIGTIEIILTPKSNKINMTLEEIEKKLGYKVRIIEK